MCTAWKKKNERNEIVCFYCTQPDIFLCGIARFSPGNKNKLRTFQPQKWKKKNSQPQTKFTGSYKKECIFHEVLLKLWQTLPWACFSFIVFLVLKILISFLCSLTILRFSDLSAWFLNNSIKNEKCGIVLSLSNLQRSTLSPRQR